MLKRAFDAGLFAFVALAICACSAGTPANPPGGAPASERALPEAKATQYLYVYDAGSPGVYSGEFARYSLPDLSLQETTASDGVASPEAFEKNSLPYFADLATGHSGVAIYLQPVKRGKVAAKQQFYGIPCVASSLVTGPTGNFYVVQYCSTNVLEYKPGASKGAKKPIATYTGGNLGKGGVTNPTYAAVDSKGDLYVGDNGGGVTYFPAGSTKGTVAYPTGYGGYVNQMVVDTHDDVWSVHGPNPTAVYFPNKTKCVPDPSGTIVRNEYAERFSKGKLAQHLYTSTSDSKVFTNAGLSMAIDSSGRIYTGNQNNGVPGVVLDFDPGTSCPNDALSFTLPEGSSPQVAVDAQRNYYVTDKIDNTVSAYKGGSLTLIKKITQAKSNVNATYAAVNP